MTKQTERPSSKPMIVVALVSAVMLVITLVGLHSEVTMIRGVGAAFLAFSVSMALFEAARRASWLGR